MQTESYIPCFENDSNDIKGKKFRCSKINYYLNL